MATNGNNFDAFASYSKLSERVENQGTALVDLRSNVNTGFQQVNANIATLSNELRSGTKTQWPTIWSAMAVCSAIIIALGTFIYGTLRENDAAIASSLERTETRLTSALVALEQTMVTRSEMEWRQARSAEDRARTEANVASLREDQVPRTEHQRVWQNFDERFAMIQRQVDEVKAAQGATFGARDALMEHRDRIERLESRRFATTP